MVYVNRKTFALSAGIDYYQHRTYLLFNNIIIKYMLSHTSYVFYAIIYVFQWRCRVNNEDYFLNNYEMIENEIIIKQIRYIWLVLHMFRRTRFRFISWVAIAMSFFSCCNVWTLEKSDTITQIIPIMWLTICNPLTSDWCQTDSVASR